MKFPTINKRAMRRVSIPEFTGGLNLRDNPVQCRDNQLTELLNMWYKDGTLRTRPVMEKITYNEFETGEYDNSRYYESKTYVHNNIVRINSAGKTEKLLSCVMTYNKRVDNTENYVTDEVCIRFVWCGTDKADTLGTISLEGGEEVLNYFVYRYGKTLYCFIKTDKSNYIYSTNNDYFQKVEEEYIYIPTIMTNCKTNHKLTSTNAHEKENNGVNLEGFNILGDYYKMVYSTVNPNADVTDNKYQMAYGLIETTSNEKYYGKIVKAEYTDKNGTMHKHSVTLHKAEHFWCWEENFSTDNLKMGVCGRQIRFKDNEGNLAYLSNEDYIEDNMVITAPYLSENKDKVFSMTRSEWFGGASAGLAGGTRLFLCGSKVEEDKALVIWSGLDEPLYFPEHSCFNVGDASQAVTGFGKQSDMLVIFKEGEVWYTQYHQNTNITSNSLISQTVFDIQSSAVYFPLTRISAEIGCRFTDTVQLCRNRLVWLGNQNRVYSLVTENQYNERNIFVVSEMIDSSLQREEISKPVAFDWNGYYCLKTGKHLYLMDYNSYGYIYVSSHSKTEDSNARIPWYYWEFSQDGSFLQCDADLLCAVIGIAGELGERISCETFKFKSGNSTEQQTLFTEKIKSVFRTKFFDFGEPHSLKNINSVGLSLGYNGGGEIKVSFITDGGEEQTSLVLEDAAEERSAAFTKSLIITPVISQVLRFGIKIESEDYVLIDGIEIDYRITGRAR